MKHKKVRDMCHNFTDLNEDEIDTVLLYIDNIQNMADEENANVYIDCISFNPRLMVIVGEAFPKGIHSIYNQELLGKVIKLDDEPAVKRTFTTGLPTTRVLAVSVPTDEKVIQSAFPIMHNNKVAGVLIFEKMLKDVSTSELGEREIYSPAANFLNQENVILNVVNEAFLCVDSNLKICYSNKAADNLFNRLGYAEKLTGMDIYNFWPEKINLGKTCYFMLSGHEVCGNIYSVNLADKTNIKYVIVISDQSEIYRLKKENRMLHNEIHEERHAWKNQLMFIYHYISECIEQEKSEEIKNTYNKINRRLDLAMTYLTMKSGKNESVSIQDFMEVLCRKAQEAVLNKKISFEISGDNFELSEHIVAPLIEVMHELISNTIKHAFPSREEGTIKIMISKGDIAHSLTVSDDGCGFDVEKIPESSNGIKIITEIIQHQLNGSLKIKSGPEGTTVWFDFIE